MQRISDILNPILLGTTGVTGAVVANAPVQFYETLAWEGTHNILGSIVVLLTLYLVSIQIVIARRKLKHKSRRKDDDQGGTS